MEKKVSGIIGGTQRSSYVTIRSADGQPKGKILRNDAGSYRSYMAEVDILANPPESDNFEIDEQDIILNEDEEEYHDEVLALVAQQSNEVEGVVEDGEEW